MLPIYIYYNRKYSYEMINLDEFSHIGWHLKDAEKLSIWEVLDSFFLT